MKAAQLLTDKALAMVEDVKKAKEYRDEFKRLGVVQIEDFAKVPELMDLGDKMWSALSPFARTSAQRHDFATKGRMSGLTTGFRFRVADPSRFRDETRGKLLKEYRELGIVELGNEMGPMLEPLIHYIIDEDLSYKRVFCFLYQEGDYISPHNDHQTGHRVNAQFPMPMNAASGFRALEEDNSLRVYYDNPGCLRILGPLVWHEVLPVLRVSEDHEPRRSLLSLRYMN